MVLTDGGGGRDVVFDCDCQLGPDVRHLGHGMTSGRSDRELGVVWLSSTSRLPGPTIPRILIVTYFLPLLTLPLD